MAIVVTGASGFIGSAYITYLNKVEPDKKIIAVDRENLDKLTSKNLNNLKLVNYISDNDFVDIIKRSFNQNFDIESIVHFGAISSTIETNFKLMMENNFKYSKILADFCKREKIPFIYASSAATYGNGTRFDDSMSPDECSPISVYSFFKNLFDKWIIENDVPALCLKYFNVFGPNEYHKEGMISFILRAYQTICNLNIKEIEIYKDDNYFENEMKRDFIYIKDAVKMTHFLVENNKTGIYNIGTGVSTPWIKVFEIIKHTLNISGVYHTYRNLVYKDGYQFFTQANISKIINDGYSEVIPPLNERIEDFYNNYLKTGKLYLSVGDKF